MPFFPRASGPAQGPTHPPIKQLPGAFSSNIKRLGRVPDKSCLSMVEVKNAWSHAYISPHAFMAWNSIKHSDNCSFILSLEDVKIFFVAKSED